MEMNKEQGFLETVEELAALASARKRKKSVVEPGFGIHLILVQDVDERDFVDVQADPAVEKRVDGLRSVIRGSGLAF